MGIFKENTLEQQLLDSCTRWPHSGFPGGLEGKASARNVGDPDSNQDLDSIPGSGRSPGEGNGNPLQYSCLKNPMDRGAWQTTVHGVTNSWTVPPSLPANVRAARRAIPATLGASVDGTCALGIHAQGILHSSAWIVTTLLSPLLRSHSAADPRVFARVSEAPTSELGS